MICPKCKKTIDENSKICTECGYDFTEITSQPPQKTAKDPLDDLDTIIKTPETYNARSEPDAKIDTNIGLKVGVLFANRYEVLSEDKAGGMGVVYKCRDRELEEIIALKIIHPDFLCSDELRGRFRREVAISRKLSHKNIVRVHDFGEFEGVPYFTMEWIEGRSLREILTARKRQNRPFALKEAQEIISQLSDALSHAHEYTVHRDIKPENIVIIEKREGIKVKLIDFGLAKMLASSGITRSGVEMGTPYYIAPEQKEDSSYVDKRADIYAVGVVLFELLTLKNTIGLEPPSEINKALPKEINEVVRKALADKPENRYGEVRELAEALDRVIQNIKEGVRSPGEELEKREKERLQRDAEEAEIRKRDEERKRKGKIKVISIAFAAVLCLIIVAYFGFRSGGRMVSPGPDVKPTGDSGKASPAPSKTISSGSKESIKGKHSETRPASGPQATGPQSPGPAPSAEPPKVAQGPSGGPPSTQNADPVNPPTAVKPKDDRKDTGTPVPDDEKRSAIVEANGYAEASQGKNMKDLREEALEDARRQALKVAETHTRSLTRGVSVVFVNSTDGKPTIAILEQKDFGIKEGKHYHIWIKAEVKYTLGKVAAVEEKVFLGPQGPLTVKIWTDKKTYREGEEMKIYLQGNKPFHARVVYMDASGKIVQLLPNAYRSQNFFEGGNLYVIPGPGDRFKLETEPPFGQEKIMVFASPNSLGDVTMEQLDKGLYGYRGDIKTLGTRSRGIRGVGVKPIEPGQPSGGAAEFYEALWQVQTVK